MSFDKTKVKEIEEIIQEYKKRGLAEIDCITSLDDLKFIERAISYNYHPAYFTLGWAYNHDNSVVPKNVEKGLQLYRKGYELGNAKCAFQLGWIEAKEYNNIQVAVKYHEFALENKCYLALFHLVTFNKIKANELCTIERYWRAGLELKNVVDLLFMIDCFTHPPFFATLSGVCSECGSIHDSYLEIFHAYVRLVDKCTFYKIHAETLFQIGYNCDTETHTDIKTPFKDKMTSFKFYSLSENLGDLHAKWNLYLVSKELKKPPRDDLLDELISVDFQIDVYNEKYQRTQEKASFLITCLSLAQEGKRYAMEKYGKLCMEHKQYAKGIYWLHKSALQENERARKLLINFVKKPPSDFNLADNNCELLLYYCSSSTKFKELIHSKDYKSSINVRPREREEEERESLQFVVYEYGYDWRELNVDNFKYTFDLIEQHNQLTRIFLKILDIGIVDRSSTCIIFNYLPWFAIVDEELKKSSKKRKLV